MVDATDQATASRGKQFLLSYREEVLTIFALFAVSILAFGISKSTAINSDDWSYFVAKVAFGKFHPVNLNDRRPLVQIVYAALAPFFGLHFEYYYSFNFLVLFLTAVMVYILVKRVFPGHGWIASLVALTFLIYPVDYTRTWFIMIYIRFWWLVSLGVIWLLLEFISTGKVWTYFLAISGIALPLGAYEGQFGVIVLASILIAFLSKKAPRMRRVLIMAGVAGVGIVFVFWRTYLQTRLFEISDAYVESLQFNLVVLVERYLYGLYIFFLGWFQPVQAQLKIMGFPVLPWLLLYFIVCFTVIILWQSSRTWPAERLETHQKLSQAKSYFTPFLVGSIFWTAGYFPIILLYQPALGITASRVNLFSVPGAALMLVSAIAFLATLLATSNFTRQLITTVILIPFIVSGVFVQNQVNRENQIKWDTQKKIWNSTFTAIPNIQEQSSLVIIIPGYQNLRPFEAFPFLSGWEIEAGAQVLYNRPDISGSYYYKDVQGTELLFTQNGFRPIPTDKVIPYKKLIFVYYDPQNETVHLVEDLEEELSLPFTANHYNPRENIITAVPATGKFRWLVK